MASNVDAAKSKTKLCRHVCIVNTCTYGKKCKFAHHPDELHASGSNHEEAVADSKKLTGEDNPRYKTVMCRHILRKAKCPLGVDCQFAHSDVDLRYPPEDGDGPYYYEGEEPEDETVAETPEPEKDAVESCQYFWKTGRCRYGRKCKFSHEIGPDSPESAKPAKPQAVVAK